MVRLALIYGMPLAALLGHGDAPFTDCLNAGPKVLPQHVCVFGARSYEPEERALLDRIGVRVIGMAEIERRGVADAMAEALGIVRSAAGGYGITIDMDAPLPSRVFFDVTSTLVTGTAVVDRVR